MECRLTFFSMQGYRTATALQTHFLPQPRIASMWIGVGCPICRITAQLFLNYHPAREPGCSDWQTGAATLALSLQNYFLIAVL